MAERTAVVHSAAELVAGPATDEGFSGDAGSLELEQYADGAVAIVDGEVAAVGPTEEVTTAYPPENADHAIDAS
ncbi:MAG: imidazolonepropionase, partial [Halobacteriales archaeon]